MIWMGSVESQGVSPCERGGQKHQSQGEIRRCSAIGFEGGGSPCESRQRRRPLEARKGKETDSLESPEGSRLANTLSLIR